MKRSVFCTVALLSALMAVSFVGMTSASGITMRHTIIAASGGAAPTGGNYVSFFNARLNVRPEVAFDATLSGPNTTGVFIGDGSRTSVIGLGGNLDPAAGNFKAVNNPFITPNGNVVFDVNFESIFIRVFAYDQTAKSDNRHGAFIRIFGSDKKICVTSGEKIEFYFWWERKC